MGNLTRLVLVGETPLGRAVFARRKLAIGLTGEVFGEVIDDPVYSSQYGMDLGGDLTLQPEAPFRFLNHSCEPNCELFQWTVTADEEAEEGWSRRMFIAVIRPIAPHEELTIDYGWPADAAIPCLCQTPGCRGWIVDVSELPLLLDRQPATAEIAG